MGRLLLGLRYTESLDLAVRQELEQLIATLQAWANASGDTRVPGTHTVDGFATITGQLAFRALLNTAQSIASGVTTQVQWTPPMNTIHEPFQYHVAGNHNELMFDGATVLYVKEPGLYALTAWVEWDSNAAGTLRTLRFNVNGDVVQYDLDAVVPVAYLIQRIVTYARFTETYLTNGNFRTNSGVPIVVEVIQDSGGARTFGRGAVSIVKIA